MSFRWPDHGAMERHGESTIEPELRLDPGGAGSAAALVLRYDGTSPPLGLIEAMVALGCGRAAVEPPPRSAIDWHRADPVRGTSYTITPYPATTRLPITGSHVAEVFARAVGLADASGVRVTGDQPADVDRDGEAEVEVVLEPHRELAVVAELDQLARCMARETTVLTRTNTYRGRTCESQVPATRLVLVVGASRLAELLAVVNPVAAEPPRVEGAEQRARTR